jgi:hypothetical protein
MKKYLIVGVCLFICLTVSANKYGVQIRLSEQLLQYVIDGKGEKAYTMLSDTVKSQIPQSQLDGCWKELVKQFGAYKGKSDWQEKNFPDKVAFSCNVHFDRITLTCLTSFDKSNKAFIFSLYTDETIPPEVQIKESNIKVITGKFELPGMLCMPQRIDKYPLVILVPGSGPSDYDETIGPNKPFRDLAQALARQGIASIRYDKRTKVYGTKSILSGKKPSMDNEYVQDVISAVQLAKNIPGIDTAKIYIVGHSQGGYLAPRFAARCKSIKGIIMMSANARPFDKLVSDQLHYVFSLDSISPEERKHLSETKRQLVNARKIGTKDFDSRIALPLGLPASYWQDINSYQPLKEAKLLSCPILILQGMRDFQVTMEDFALWKKELSGKTNVTFMYYPRLNHLYMEGEGKSVPSEYYTFGAIPDYVSADIANWIINNTK